jgi:hypothetical protein
MTLMTMNRRGALNVVGHPPEMSDGREHKGSTSATKCDADPEPRAPTSSQTSPAARRDCHPARLWKACILGALFLRLHCLTRRLLFYFGYLRVARPVARGDPRAPRGAPRGSPPPPERSARGRLGHSPGQSFPLRRVPPTVRRATLRRRPPGRRSIARRPDGAS